MKKESNDGSRTGAGFEEAQTTDRRMANKEMGIHKTNHRGVNLEDARRLELWEDIVRGGMNIAELMYGERTKQARRKAYHAASTSRLPFFKMGSTWCIRRSKLEEHIAEQERNHQKR